MHDDNRRRAASASPVGQQKSDMIGEAMRDAFKEALDEPLPARLKNLLSELRQKEKPNGEDRS